MQVLKPRYPCLAQFGRALRPMRMLSSSTETAASNDAIRDMPDAVTITATRPDENLGLQLSLASGKKAERSSTKKRGQMAIGSRRRRAALLTSDRVPFEELPYECFQEARRILAEDRQETIAKINRMKHRLHLAQQRTAEQHGGENSKKVRITQLQELVRRLIIQADLNDPIIKKRFEDGVGNMDKPIYRHLAEQKWKSYDRKVMVQRIEQFRIAPDLLRKLEPTCSMKLAFRGRRVQPGAFVESRYSETKPPSIHVQVFDKGPRLVTIALVDPDVPNAEDNTFSSRCHFLAVNIPLSPSSPRINLAGLKEAAHLIHPWYPPYSQKGAPYHRLVAFVLQQNQETSHFDMKSLRGTEAELSREGWTLKSFLKRNPSLKPMAATLFRIKWDQGTDGVMERLGVPGRELEYVRLKPERNIYKKKDGERYR